MIGNARRPNDNAPDGVGRIDSGVVRVGPDEEAIAGTPTLREAFARARAEEVPPRASRLDRSDGSASVWIIVPIVVALTLGVSVWILTALAP